MRLFLGIEISALQKQAIASLLSPVKNSEKGWENSHDYHITTLFIGEVRDEEVTDIERKMGQVHSPPFSLVTSGVKFFNRRIMYLGFEDCEEVFRLRDRIREVFPEYVRRDEKEFVPHITLKRWQRYEFDHLVNGLAEIPRTSFHIPVRELALFKSEKDEANRKYHVIFRSAFTS